MTKLRQIHLLLVDDHAVVRQALHALLELQPDFKVVAEAGDAAEAVRLARKWRPHVVVMDVSLKAGDGLSATRRITRAVKTGVVILSMHADEDLLRRAVQAGARGYVVKGADTSELLSAIRAVRRGEFYLCAMLLAVVLKSLAQREPRSRRSNELAVLSGREREVVSWLVQGLSTRDVGRRLFISIKTVQTHRANAMKKLGVANLPALVKLAVREGLVGFGAEDEPSGKGASFGGFLRNRRSEVRL